MERYHFFDFVKCFSIFFVVCFHTFLLMGIGAEGGMLDLIINNFPRFVIPFFFISSGFFFGKKMILNTRPKDYFIQYTLRLFKLFIFWFFIYTFYDCIIKVITSIFLGNNLKNLLIEYFSTAFNIGILYYGIGTTAFHLWYLTALIWSILIAYFFIIRKKLTLLLIISFIFNILGLFGQTYSGIFYLNLQTRDALFFGLFYTTLGIVFAQKENILIKKLALTSYKTLVFLLFLFSITQFTEKFITIFCGKILRVVSIIIYLPFH